MGDDAATCSSHARWHPLDGAPIDALLKSGHMQAWQQPLVEHCPERDSSKCTINGFME